MWDGVDRACEERPELSTEEDPQEHAEGPAVLIKQFARCVERATRIEFAFSAWKLMLLFRAAPTHPGCILARLGPAARDGVMLFLLVILSYFASLAPIKDKITSTIAEYGAIYDKMTSYVLS